MSKYKHLTEYSLFEGVSRDGENYKFDFSGDKEGDIMSLKFSDTQLIHRKIDGVLYSYYFAYKFDSKLDRDMLVAVKKLDDTIDPADAEMLVKKAVIGLDHKFKLNTFDTIVYPKSSSAILKEMAEQANAKAGNAELIPDAFVKSARSEIKFDYDKIDKLPESTKKQVMSVIDKIKAETDEFKLKEIYVRYRKFITDFMIFNSDEDRRMHNSIVGKKVLLIDDYRTTGATIKEMLGQLAKLGPTEIVVFVMIKVE